VNKGEPFLEVADVSRELGLSPATIKAAVQAGKLAIAATTLRGVRLFVREEVERYKRARRHAASVGSLLPPAA
jgi:hypothetical protein